MCMKFIFLVQFNCYTLLTAASVLAFKDRDEEKAGEQISLQLTSSLDSSVTGDKRD